MKQSGFVSKFATTKHITNSKPTHSWRPHYTLIGVVAAEVKKAAWEHKIKRASDVGMWEGAKPFLAESGLVCSANAAVLHMAVGGNAHIVGLGDPGYREVRAPR